MAGGAAPPRTPEQRAYILAVDSRRRERKEKAARWAQEKRRRAELAKGLAEGKRALEARLAQQEAQEAEARRMAEEREFLREQTARDQAAYEEKRRAAEAERIDLLAAIRDAMEPNR